MGKYNDLIGQADLEIEGCKNFLTEIEKLQQSLEKAASVQRKLIEEKVLVRHKCQSFKKLSSDRTSAVSCILNALLCELPLSYCDEARFVFFCFLFCFVLFLFLFLFLFFFFVFVFFLYSSLYYFFFF